MSLCLLKVWASYLSTGKTRSQKFETCAFGELSSFESFRFSSRGLLSWKLVRTVKFTVNTLRFTLWLYLNHNEVDYYKASLSESVSIRNLLIVNFSEKSFHKLGWFRWSSSVLSAMPTQTPGESPVVIPCVPGTSTECGTLNESIAGRPLGISWNLLEELFDSQCLKASRTSSLEAFSFVRTLKRIFTKSSPIHLVRYEIIYKQCLTMQRCHYSECSPFDH